MPGYPAIRPLARVDMEEIIDWLKSQNPPLAGDFLDELEACLSRLAEFPERGAPRTWRHPMLEGVRMIPLPRFTRYLVFYRCSTDGVEVIRVLHGSRDIEAVFEE